MPLAVVRLKIIRVAFEHRHRIIFRIDRKREQFEIGIPLPLPLQTLEPLAQHGALALTAGKNKVRDPNLALELIAGKNLSRLVFKSEIRGLVYRTEEFI